MPTYKLYYFDSRGRAEIARWLFKLAGKDFEDIRYTREEWVTKKADFPFQQLPVLEVTDDNGKTTMIPQSGTITRYLAREFGYCGQNNLEMARVEFLCDQMLDTMMKLFIQEEDPEKKKQKLKEVLEGPFAKNMSLLEGFVLPNGYFVGDKVTLADIGWAAATEGLTIFVPSTFLDATPKLKALAEKVKTIPEIKAWIEIRPKTAM